jgi:hypothetical protein
VDASERQWHNVSPGVDFAPVYGDWAKGAHGKIVRLAPGTVVPMHTHANDERGVMISGRLLNRYQDGTSAEMTSGSGFIDAWKEKGKGPGHTEECVSSEPCYLYSHSDGRWEMNPVTAD